MKVGIVSDIHCNIAGLDRALAEMGDVDELICAGDAIYQFRFSNEVIARLRERGARIVLGNHEETFLGRDGERARQAPWIQADLLTFISQQPYSLTATFGGRRLLVTHGSPFDPFNEYVYPHSPTLRRFGELDADIVILGHTHFQMAERVGKTLVINPGSAGEPRDTRNDYRLSFAVLDTDSEEVRFGSFPDPSRTPGARTDLHWSTWNPHNGTTDAGHGQTSRIG
ncbi:MAG: metallophosphoesterase family protein [Dehalococcoidia bacterium]